MKSGDPDIVNDVIKMGDFNCDFDAPMFVDFENMESGENDPDVESYFDRHHEPETLIPTQMEEDTPTVAKDTPTLLSTTKDTPTVVAASPPTNVVTSWDFKKATPTRTTKVDTPTRKALRKAVSETIREITNSPKIRIPETRVRKSPVKRLQDPPTKNKGSTPKMGGANKGGVACSPGIARWRKAIKQMTPEILKNARAAKQLRKIQVDQEIRDKPAKKTFKEQLASSRRLAEVKKKVPEATATSRSSSASAPVRPTNPEPFKFATDSRIKMTHNKPMAAGKKIIYR